MLREINAAVVTWLPFDIAPFQEAPSEAPGLWGASQADQQVSNLFVVITQQRASAIAGLADTKRPAGQFD
jgi:hypothetical protein